MRGSEQTPQLFRSQIRALALNSRSPSLFGFAGYEKSGMPGRVFKELAVKAIETLPPRSLETN